jgi:hypothetical protein
MILTMRAFWYASPQKLDAYGAEGGSRLPRIGGVELGGFPPSIEVALQSASNRQKLERAVGRLEEGLRRRKHVVPVREVPQRGPVTFFEYQGPSARRVSYAFYVAAVSDTIGVLLVGSAKNAIGAPKDWPGILGSEDPMAAIRHLFARHGHHAAVEELGEVISEVSGHPPPGTDYSPQEWIPGTVTNTHARIFIENGLQLASLPHTKGVALYAGVQDTSFSDMQDAGYVYLPPSSDPALASVSAVVVGSPIWIEQVRPHRTSPPSRRMSSPSETRCRTQVW